MHNARIVCPKTTGRIISGFLSRSVAKAERESTQKRECFNASTDTISNWSGITENSSTWKNQMLCPWNSPCEVVLGRLGGLRTNSKQKTMKPLGVWVYWHNQIKVQLETWSSCGRSLCRSFHSSGEQRGCPGGWQPCRQRLFLAVSPIALTLLWPMHFG